mmetsp:Transcript_2362/g.6615  ORF Transcript_2362/g.6615 Transcript_2362/m.6615 type:complete len:202 (-) Transcript_2362:250-855(-)
MEPAGRHAARASKARVRAHPCSGRHRSSSSALVVVGPLQRGSHGMARARARLGHVGRVAFALAVLRPRRTPLVLVHEAARRRLRTRRHRHFGTATAAAAARPWACPCHVRLVLAALASVAPVMTACVRVLARRVVHIVGTLCDRCRLRRRRRGSLNSHCNCRRRRRSGDCGGGISTGFLVKLPNSFRTAISCEAVRRASER